MATWTTISNLAVGSGGIPSGATVTALRDNPVAIAEGAAGAPRVAGIAAMSHAGELEAIGTWAYLHVTDSTFTTAPGSTRPASELAYANKVSSGAAVSAGTWRCMGDVRNEGDVFLNVRSTLWLRIS